VEGNGKAPTSPMIAKDCRKPRAETLVRVYETKHRIAFEGEYKFCVAGITLDGFTNAHQGEARKYGRARLTRVCATLTFIAQ
jgi:hypothetical protein